MFDINLELGTSKFDFLLRHVEGNDMRVQSCQYIVEALRFSTVTKLRLSFDQ